APAAAPPAAASPAPSLATPIPLATDLRGKRQPPWMAIAMIAAAAAFGVTVAIVLFLRPAQQPPAPVIVQVPVAPVATTGAPSPRAPPAPEMPEPTATPAPVKRAPNVPAVPKETAAAAPPSPPARGPLDLHGLTGQPTVAPTDDPGTDGP